MMQHNMAIVGFGGMGGWHREKLEKQLPSIQVVSVYDVREEARQKAEQLGLKAYKDFQELLEDGDIELVLVATPNNFHKEYVIRCLEAGKNVICEKPVAMNASELEEMAATAKRAGKLFSVHQNRRWDRDYLMVKEVLSGGQIGTPYFVESRVQGSRGAMHGWRSYQVNGGGMLLDWGVHLIDQALNLIDAPVVSVDAHLKSVFSQEVDDSIKVLLRFENDLSYLLEMTTNCFINQPRWHVSCTGGTAVVQNWECEGQLSRLKENGPMEWADDIVYTAAGPTRTMAPRPPYTVETLPLPELQSDSIDYYRNILGVLEGSEELLVKPEQALRVMRVIDLAFASGKARHGLECHI